MCGHPDYDTMIIVILGLHILVTFTVGVVKGIIRQHVVRLTLNICWDYACAHVIINGRLHDDQQLGEVIRKYALD